MTAYRFERAARSRTGWVFFGVALVVWLFLGLVSAHWLLILVFAIPPVIMGRDLWRNPVGRLTISDTVLAFDNGRQAREIPLSQIDKVRILRRMDLSWIANVLLIDGKKLRLPPDCTPPGESLEAELTARGVRTERVLFSLTG